MPPPRHSRHAAPRVCRGMDELRVSAIDTLAQISHTMASQVDPIAKLRRIAAVTAIHTDMMYSALGAPAARKPSVVLAIGAAPAVEDFDDEVEEADEAWPDDEADEARPATGGAGDVYDDTWEIEEGDETWPEDTWETESGPNATSSSSASAPLITSTSAAALDATESTSGSSASTGIRKHTGEALLQSPIVKKARPARNPTTPPKTPTPPKYPPPHLRPGRKTDTF